MSQHRRRHAGGEAEAGVSRLTKQGVRDLNDIRGTSRGRRPSREAIALAHGRRPHCEHFFVEVEQYDEWGMYCVGFLKRCTECGVTK